MSEEGVTVTQSFALCCWAERAMGSREHCCGSVLSPARVCSPPGPARVCSPMSPARVCSPVSRTRVCSPTGGSLPASPSFVSRLCPNPRPLCRWCHPTEPPCVPRRHSCKEMPKLSVPATSVSWPGPHFRGSRKACGDWSPRVPGWRVRGQPGRPGAPAQAAPTRLQ